jgi:transposase
MEELRMSAKERVRLDALHRVERDEMTVVAAAGLMGVSLRQARRLWKRFKGHGAVGLVHRSRGRPSNRRLPEELRQRIVKRHQERYWDFGPTLASEKLAEEGLAISPDTLVALLKERHLWHRKRRRGKHRQRRERRASFGSLLQMDGSHHDWFEGRAPWCVLMVVIDDATNRTFARFYPAETTPAAFDVFGRWVKRHGLPRGLYVDRHGIYRDDDHPERPTQFGRAMRDLRVELICAHSPQAKGRVERRHAVFQDRLVKEMRLRNISDMDQANAFLERFFLPELNRRYAVTPRQPLDLHRVLPPDLKLEEVLCLQEPRVVGRDWCLRWHNQFLQIPAVHAALDLAGKTVLLKELAGGKLLVTYRGQALNYRVLPARPLPARERVIQVNRRPWKPGANHPWKNDPVGRAALRRGGPAPAPVGASAAPPPRPTPPPARHAAGLSWSG